MKLDLPRAAAQPRACSSTKENVLVTAAGVHGGIFTACLHYSLYQSAITSWNGVKHFLRDRRPVLVCPNLYSYDMTYHARRTTSGSQRQSVLACNATESSGAQRCISIAAVVFVIWGVQGCAHQSPSPSSCVPSSASLAPLRCSALFLPPKTSWLLG